MHARERSDARWLAGLVVFALLFWCFDLALLRAGVPAPLDDTWEYGVAARHLLAGDGFRTDVIHPPLWTLRDARLTVPVLVHGPLLPVLLAPLVALHGERAIGSVAPLAAAAALIAAWLTARLGARAFGAPVGVAAGALFTLAPITVRAAHHDPSLLIGAALLAGALDLMLRTAPRALAAGVALGLAGLARAEMSLAILALAPLAGRRGVVPMLAGAMLCLAPWWIHTALATGQPWFNLSSYLLIGYTPAHPGLSVLRDFSLPPAAFPRALSAALPSLPAKWAETFPHALKRVLLTPTGGTGWLAALGGTLTLVRAWTTPRGARMLALVARLLPLVALAAIPVAIMILMVYDTRYLVPFLPLWTLAAARGAEALSAALPEWGRRPRAWCGALALLALPSVAPALREEQREARIQERASAAERVELRAWATGSRTPIFSDTPDFVAYETRRPVIWMTEREYRALESSPDSAGRPRPADHWFHRSSHE